MQPRLIALPYSPWSIKAKWALDHHRVAYRYVPHLPLLGEPLLRMRARKWSGRVSVPLLMTDDGPIADSWEIAKWAEAHADKDPLFMSEHEDTIREWNARSEVLLDAGRALALAKMMRSRKAQAEGVPAPAAIQPLLSPAGWLGIRFLSGKYGAIGQEERHTEELRMGLRTLSKAIERDDGSEGACTPPPARPAEPDRAPTPNGARRAPARFARDFLVGDSFSYADIAMAVGTFFVKPAGRGIDHLGDATRECWTQHDLAEEFAHVIAWRDRVLARRPRT